MKTWVVMNVRGLVIGTALARTAAEAVRKWNRANVRSAEFAVEAYDR